MTALSYSMVRIACIDDAFLEIFELEASPVESQSLQQKDRKRRKRKGKRKKKTEKPKDVHVHVGHFLDFCARPSKNVIVERKAHCLVANGFLSRLELIWVISRLKCSK